MPDLPKPTPAGSRTDGRDQAGNHKRTAHPAADAFVAGMRQGTDNRDARGEQRECGAQVSKIGALGGKTQSIVKRWLAA